MHYPCYTYQLNWMTLVVQTLYFSKEGEYITLQQCLSEYWEDTVGQCALLCYSLCSCVEDEVCQYRTEFNGQFECYANITAYMLLFFLQLVFSCITQSHWAQQLNWTSNGRSKCVCTSSGRTADVQITSERILNVQRMFSLRAVPSGMHVWHRK